MIKVLIAEDQQLFRDLLEMMLSSNDDIQVTGGARDGNEAFEMARTQQPDVVLMDIHMPVCNGIEAVKKIKAAGLPCKILVLTASYGEEDVSDAIRSGADGYILKSVSKEELALAIRSVHTGMEVLHKDVREVARRPVPRVTAERREVKILLISGIEVKLNERELKIIKMVVDGKTTSEIAQELYLAEGRVRNIITELISKLMLKDRTQLAVFAIRHHLVD